MATEHHMPCTLTYLHDPVFGRGAVPVAGIEEDGTLIPDRSGTVDPIPVVMFEPPAVVVIRDSRTGTAHETRTEVIIAAGFHRIPAGPVWAALPAEGWGVYRTSDGIVLRDPDGAVYAEGTVLFDPAWVSTATSLGSVLVLHGPRLGIRTPPGRTKASYTVENRAKEIKQGRREGFALRVETLSIVDALCQSGRCLLGLPRLAGARPARHDTEELMAVRTDVGSRNEITYSIK